MIHLWRGFHSQTLVELLRQTWSKQELLIVVPPNLKDFGFLELFSEINSSDIVFHGDWSECSLPPQRLPQDGLVRHRSTDGMGRQGLTDAVLGVFTSGTQSGFPRLIFYSRKNVMSSLEAIRELFDASRITSIFVYPQPSHSFGLVLGYLQAIVNHLRVDFVEGPYSRTAHSHWLETVDSGTLTLGTPTHFLDLIKTIKKENKFPTRSYSAIVGGALVTKRLWQQLREDLNIEAPSIGYGATEASPGVTHLRPGVPPLEDGDIGYALHDVVIDCDAGLLEVAEGGLLFSGPNLCLAVYENGELKKFNRFLIKDQLRVYSFEGQMRYTFLGRTDLVINRGGAKYSLEAIESRLSSRLESPCLAVALYDERLGEDLGLLCEAVTVPPAKIQALVKEEFGLSVSAINIVFGEIPFNPNKKFDRGQAQKAILRQKPWSFPIRVEHLKGYLPHRGSAVWIDSILEAQVRRGLGRVVVDLEKNYCSQGRVRESACIEWVAQTYGFTVAANDLTGIASVDRATKVFLVEVKNSDFFFADETVNHGDELEIVAICTHDFGPLKVIEGQVFRREKLLARVGITLYRE